MLWLMVVAQATAVSAVAGHQDPPRNVAVTPPAALVSIPLVMPPTTLPHGPVPTNRALGWITATDYPADAMSRHEQGGTGFILLINIRGEVTGCTVNASSGSPTLDRATCDLLRQRARFTPALDGEGKPVAGTYASRANWQLPLLGYAPHPPVPRNSYGWITAMDYPAAALKNKDMGVTGFTLDVDGEGRVPIDQDTRKAHQRQHDQCCAAPYGLFQGADDGAWFPNFRFLPSERIWEVEPGCH